jgi:hypothetical protein
MRSGQLPMRVTYRPIVLLGLLACERSSQPAAARSTPPPGQVWLTARQAEQVPVKLEAVATHALHDTVLLGGLVTAKAGDGASILADVAEVDLPEIKIGAAVTAKLVALPNKTFEGTVEWIAGALDPVSHSAKVRSTILDPERLLAPGMSATVAVWTHAAPGLAIRPSALLRLGTTNEVFVHTGALADGRLRFERRAVTVDEPGAEWVRVLSGLGEGERVVTAGGIFLAAEASR